MKKILFSILMMIASFAISSEFKGPVIDVQTNSCTFLQDADVEEVYQITPCPAKLFYSDGSLNGYVSIIEDDVNTKEKYPVYSVGIGYSYRVPCTIITADGNTYKSTHYANLLMRVGGKNGYVLHCVDAIKRR